MNTTDETREQTLLDRICEALTDDGDEYALSDHQMLRLKIEQDESSVDMWSDDCYGNLALVEWPRHGGHEKPRPEGFNGRARKIQANRSDAYWWQPPADVNDAHVGDLMQLVTSIVREGFYSVGVELMDGTDAYGRSIVTHAQWLSGIEPMAGTWEQERYAASRAYYNDTIREQVVELLNEIGVVQA